MPKQNRRHVTLFMKCGLMFTLFQFLRDNACRRLDGSCIATWGVVLWCASLGARVPWWHGRPPSMSSMRHRPMSRWHKPMSVGRGHVAWALGSADVGRRLVPGCHGAHGGMVGHHGRPL